MIDKRNFDRYTDATAARRNILALCRKAPGERMSKSVLGYAAYPGYDFRSRQGAAFSVAKIVRHMIKDGHLDHELKATPAGLAWLAEQEATNQPTPQ